MKRLPLVLTLFFALAQNCFSQLTLQSQDGKRTLKISPNATIGLKFPHESPSDLCETYRFYKGEYRAAEPGSVSMVLQEKTTVFTDKDGISKNEEVKYAYLQREVVTSIPTSNLNAVMVYSKSRKTMDALGGILMMAAAAQGLIIGPFLEGDARKTSDKIVLGTFGLGFTLAILPNKKTYFLEAPVKGKVGRLWRVK